MRTSWRILTLRFFIRLNSWDDISPDRPRYLREKVVPEILFRMSGLRDPK